MSPSRQGERDASGFALILVVWLLVLIGAIGTYLVANGRSETVQARNIGAAASAEALADAAIARAVFNQTDPALSNRWKLDGAAHQVVLPSGTVEIHLADETQKINPNLASNSLLAALFQTCGVEQGAAHRLGNAVADWVKDDKENASAPDPYRAAGRSYSAPHAPIESLDELGLVLGMTPEILTAVRPYLTIYTDTPAPEAETAPAVIQRALALAARISPDEDDATDAGSTPAQSGTLPQAAPASAGAKSGSSEERLVEANIIARSRNGGVFVRYAVLRLGQENGKAYAVLDWRRGVLDDQKSGS